MSRKTSYIVAGIILAINVVVCIYVIKKLNEDPENKAVIEGNSSMKDMQEGTNDNPRARAEYEFNRMKDPATGTIPMGMRGKELAFAAHLPKKFDVKINGKDRSKNMQTQTWTRRGPNDVGGRTRAVGIDVSNESRILAGGVSGGMWLSADTGHSWVQTTLPSQLHSVSCLAQDRRTNHRNVWYFGGGETDGNSATGLSAYAAYLGDGIYKSIDSGLSWSVLPATANDSPQVFNNNFDYVWKIVPYANDTVHDVVFAATYAHIYRSMDGGTTWNSVLGASNNSSSYTDVEVTPSGILYAAFNPSVDHGIYRSSDSGTTWTSITPTGWPAVYHRTIIAVAPSNENTVYFLSETPNTGKLGHNLWKYTYLSGDGSGAGGTWVNLSQSIPALGGNANYDSQSSYDMVLKVRPDNENIVFLGGTNLYRSTNGFADTTTNVLIGGYNVNSVDPLGRDGVYQNHHPDQHGLAFFSDPTKMVSSNDGGVQLTNDNTAATVAWVSLNNGYYNSQFYTVAIDHGTSGDPVIIGGMQDNGNFWTNSLSTAVPWIPITGADGTYTAVADGKAYYYGAIQNGLTGRLNIDNTGAVNLFTATRIDPTGGAGYLFINPLLLDPNNTNRMYMAGGAYVWRNDNLSGIPPLSFNTTTSGWTKLTNSLVSGTITAMGHGKNSDNLYYGTQNGRIYRIDNPDVGNPNKVDIWTGKGLPPNAYVSCIAVKTTDGATAIATFSNYNVKSIYYTSDGGNTWASISGNLEQHPDGSGNGPSVRWAAIIPTQDSIYYFVGTSTGLYSTTHLNGDSTVWTQEGANTIGNVVVDYIDFRQSDGLIVIATHGNGVFSATLPNPSGITSFKSNDMAIDKAYPNPFSTSVTISYSLKTAGQVILKVKDINGHEICKLEDKYQQPGTYDYSWDGRNDKGIKLPDGIYFATLISGSNNQTKKIVYIR